MSRLVALPVNGDAFLLERPDCTILVDGGWRSDRLAAELNNYATNHLDIVVCTHADSDHAGGLVDILDTSRITIDEFWLPGAWLESLPVLLPHPEHVVEGLVREAESFTYHDPHFPDDDENPYQKQLDLEALRQRGAQRDKTLPLEDQKDHHGKSSGLDWLKGWVAGPEIEDGDAKAARIFRNGENRIRYRARRGRIPYHAASAWIGLIKTAERIRKIALQAVNRNVCVRWFDYQEFKTRGGAQGGEPGLLIPLNSIELLTPPRPIAELSYLAQLSEYNEKSLVFLSPGYEGSDDPHLSEWNVVFTGDSPLGDGANYANSLLDWPPDVSPKAIATAPHHGSENNAYAYHHLSSVVEVWMWLRSGGLPMHPGETYRSLPFHERSCTHCPHLGLPRQPIEVEMVMPSAIFTSGHICACPKDL